VTGQAVPRTGSVPDGDHNHGSGYYPYYPGYIYDPYYSYYYNPFYSTRYGYWAPYGYGYGLGYFSYDPFLFGAFGYPYYGGVYDPYASGGGYSVALLRIDSGSDSIAARFAVAVRVAITIPAATVGRRR